MYDCSLSARAPSLFFACAPLLTPSYLVATTSSAPLPISLNLHTIRNNPGSSPENSLVHLHDKWYHSRYPKKNLVKSRIRNSKKLSSSNHYLKYISTKKSASKHSSQWSEEYFRLYPRNLFKYSNILRYFWKKKKKKSEEWQLILYRNYLVTLDPHWVISQVWLTLFPLIGTVWKQVIQKLPV